MLLTSSVSNMYKQSKCVFIPCHRKCRNKIPENITWKSLSMSMSELVPQRRAVVMDKLMAVVDDSFHTYVMCVRRIGHISYQLFPPPAG